jgi:glycine/D-amino acid oxidase-like deaminating enzyme
MERASGAADFPSAGDLARGRLTQSASLTFRPFWWEAAPPDPGDADVPREVDVVIVGSGYTGLSAALTLARRGRGCVVLDRGVIGEGASTRNGGQIGSGNQKASAAALASASDGSRSLDLLREGQRAFDHLVSFIADEGIDCQFRRCGRFRGAMRPDHYERLARTMDELGRAVGLESFMVPRSDQHQEVGTDVFHGGTVIVHDASLHPGQYHAGVLQRARAAGAIVAGRADVTSISRNGNGFRVATARGDVKCGNVTIATDGYTGDLAPPLKRRIVPIVSAQIATGEIPDQIFAGLAPRDRVYGNTARVFSYFRLVPGERRLLFGGRGARFGRDDVAQSFSHLARKMLRFFPALETVPITHAWSGLIGQTWDGVPHIGKTAEGVHFALGYCGNAGVARGTYFGNKVALKVLGDADGRTAYDDLTFPSFPARPIAARVVPAVEAFMSLRDRLNW